MSMCENLCNIYDFWRNIHRRSLTCYNKEIFNKEIFKKYCINIFNKEVFKKYCINILLCDDNII